DVVHCDLGVFDDIMDQPAGNGRRIELEIDEDLGDFDAVRDVLVPGEPLLANVRPLAEPIGALEQLPIQTFRKSLLEPAGKGLFLLFLDRACRQSSPASAKLM